MHLAFLFFSIATGCHPITPGLYVFETTDIRDDTCQMFSLDDFPTDDATITWDDKETLRIEREGGDMVMAWDGEFFTLDETFREDAADGCVLTDHESHVGTPDGRQTLVLETDIELDSIGACGALALSLPCKFTLERIAEIQL